MVEPLIIALKDKHEEVRSSAAAALGKLEDTRAVEPLIAVLKDEDVAVVAAAKKAIEKIRFWERMRTT